MMEVEQAKYPWRNVGSANVEEHDNIFLVMEAMEETTAREENVDGDANCDEEAADYSSVGEPEPEPEPTDEELYDTDLELEEAGNRTYRSMSPEDIYLKSCEELGVVPASYFITHLYDETMNMSHHGLGPNGVKAIAAPLVINTSILELDISDNWMTAEGMKDISDMLMENCYISKLNISCNKLGTEGARHISSMLHDNTTLRALNVSRNDFRDSDAQYFEEAMRANFKLKELDLSGNQFCEIGGEWMGQAIAANEAIDYLNLSWNHLRLRGALAVCAGMKSNFTIKTLDLSWNGFADEGAMAMGEALKSNSTLTSLDLSHNRITDRGAMLLAKGLEVNDTLKTLRIGNNPMGTEGALALIRAIRKNDKSAIEELDLAGVRINKEFLDLAEQVRQRVATSGSKTAFNFIVRQEEQKMKVSKSPDDGDDHMMVLQKFLEDKRLRLIDLFRNFDKDLSWKISPAEFKKGIIDAGIPFSKAQLRKLMQSLDTDSDGQVNYKELLTGRQGAIMRRREIRKKELEAKEREKKEADKFLAVWKDTVRPKTPTGSSKNSPSQTPLRSGSLVVPSKANSPRSPRSLAEKVALRLKAEAAAASPDVSSASSSSLYSTQSSPRGKQTPKSVSKDPVEDNHLALLVPSKAEVKAKPKKARRKSVEKRRTRGA